ncbi:MAG: hypothetical protein L6R41_000179 [Letrouitia leprolyta]|nr:MAG: hypothetical protein L6R41_000179 [Letrouitia leprolyta]
MSSILENAQEKIKAEITRRGDVPITPPDLPWIFADSGLNLTTSNDRWWTWQILSDAVTGLQYCAFRKGVFKEIEITGIYSGTKAWAEGMVYMSLTRQDTKEALDGFSAQCDVPETTTTLRLVRSGRKLDSLAMDQILDKAQTELKSRIGRGDRHLNPNEIPWVFSSNGLIIKAELSGWSFRMLINTIEGLQACAYDHGIFEEIFVTSVDDPRGIDPMGSRFLSLIRDTKSTKDVSAPRPLPPDLQRCEDDDTHTRVFFQLMRPIGAYAMQQVLDGAQAEVRMKIAAVGEDSKLQPSEIPWDFLSDGLIITADYEGWTWGFLDRTITAVRNCTFRKGLFGEVMVVDIVGQGAPSGQRYLRLKKQV